MDALKNHINIIEEILSNRSDCYGSTQECFGDIAKSWSSYLNTYVSERDVAVMMCLLKIARYKQNKDHEDSILDLGGYAVLAGVL